MTLRAALLALPLALAAITAAAPAWALGQPQGQTQAGQQGGGMGQQAGPASTQRAERVVQPYIEVSQILSAELSPGDDVLTFTTIAVGVDINLQGRNSGAAVSLRYERNIGYDNNSVDADTISGVARGTLALIPNTLSFEAGALASRTRVDAGGGGTANPLVREDAESRFYSFYAGPSLSTRAGDVDERQIAVGHGADHRGLELEARHKAHGHLLVVAHHVGGGHRPAVGLHNEARAVAIRRDHRDDGLLGLLDVLL